MGILEPIEESDLHLPRENSGQAAEKKEVVENIENSGTFVLEEIPSQAETAQEKEMPDGFNEILSKVGGSGAAVLSSVDMAAVQDDVKQTNELETVQTKIEALVKIATTKGVMHAVEVARKMQDNYTLDELHDKLLADDLHEALIKSGLIKEM